MEDFYKRANKLIGIIWQVSDNLPTLIKEKIQFLCLSFLSEASLQKWQEGNLYLKAIKNLLQLATYANFLRLVNFEILSKEIEKIEKEIFDFHKFTSQKSELDLREIFSLSDNSEKSSSKVGAAILSKQTSKEAEISEDKAVSMQEDVKAPFLMSVILEDLSDRQRLIVDFLFKQKGQVRASEIYNLFPGTNARTIRREIKELHQRNILKRERDGNKFTYSLNTAILGGGI